MNIISLSTEFERLADAKSLPEWIALFEQNIQKLKEVSQDDKEQLAHIVNVFTKDLHAMQNWLKIHQSEDELTTERDRLRGLKIMKDKKRLGIF